jgi:CRP-like cAMP-binding protein
LARPPVRQETIVNRYESNLFLRSLDPEDFRLLTPHLRTVELARGSMLVSAGEIFKHVYFPISGSIAFLSVLSGGETLGMGMIGRESFFGSMSALDSGLALNDAIVQVAGAAMRMEVGPFRAAAKRSASFRDAKIRHEQALIAQALQSASCRAFHAVDARLARWLLRAADISDGGALPLTQEFLGQMLGARRSSVSTVAHRLQRAGVIRYVRGTIEIVDCEGLKDVACECYGVLKGHYDRLPRVQPGE